MKKVIDTETPYCVEDFVSFTDLLFRWPYLTAYKILFGMRNYDLHVFHVEGYSSTLSKEKIIHLEPTVYKPKHDDMEFCLEFFNRLAFLADEISVIEAKYGYQIVPDDLEYFAKSELCNISNVNRLAPQILYTALCFPEDEHVTILKVDEFLNSEIRRDIELFDSIRKDKKCWRLSHKRLWAKYSLPNPNLLHGTIDKNDLIKLDAFIQDKWNKGLHDNDILLALIAEYVDHLRNEDLGELLPAKGRPILQNHTKDMDNKQGHRLRGKLKNMNIDEILQ